MAFGTGTPARESGASASRPYGLSPRELEVVRYLVAGYSPKEISQVLFVGHARDYLQAAKRKMGVAHLYALIHRWNREQGGRDDYVRGLADGMAIGRHEARNDR